MNNSDWKKHARWLISRAALAPSSHNTQPWIFRVSESTIELYADRTRALPVNDTDDRELTISCGCALLNLRIAAASDGLDSNIHILPDQADEDLLARVTFANAVASTTADAELSAMIERRRTYRKKFDDRAVSDEVVNELVDAAASEGAWLRPLQADDLRREVAALVSEGDSIQWDNDQWRRELAAWMHPRRRGDGLSLPALAVAVAQWVVRTFDLGGGVAAKDQQLAEGSPLLALLGTDTDEPRDWLQAGQALQRVLLVGCRHGLQASYLNQPVQVYALRSKLQNLVAGGFPQILLRFGFPVEGIPAAPRRNVDDVIEHA
jgi:Nitroreductase family